MRTTLPSDLKTILHSKRANLYYLEYCRVVVNGGRVEYITEQGKEQLYWNIPIANTSCVLLGSGTSVTQQAMREFARAGVMVGFCGGGGTPLYSGSECFIDIHFIEPQSEYRPVHYIQKWLAIWSDEGRRLMAAKQIQEIRGQFIRHCWADSALFDSHVFKPEATFLHRALSEFKENLQQAENQQAVLLAEARFTKRLYGACCKATGYQEFTRVKQGKGIDFANKNLDQGNYLAYGLAATATWVLGLPHGLSVLHGKTRKGGLVFDIADMVKDGLVLPQAFVSAMQGEKDSDFKQRCLHNFRHAKVMDFMIDGIKSIVSSFNAEQGRRK